MPLRLCVGVDRVLRDLQLSGRHNHPDPQTVENGAKFLPGLARVHRYNNGVRQ